MRRTDTLVIGGGQAGLAMSRRLADRGIEHVVLERGRVGERWRSERWDSLRLLTPNWQTRLPGWSYRGPDPDGFMTREEVTAYLEGYARSFPSTVETGVRVISVEKDEAAYRILTEAGTWRADRVVIATGNCDIPRVPAFGKHLRPDVVQVVPSKYRRPSDLPPGGVLVVGASATGIQLAEEIHRSGRPVTLSVGRHTRLPRRYRGRDIQWWLDAMGIWNETRRDVQNLAAARQEPSLQLVGSDVPRTLDLPVLEEQGIRLVGRAVAADGDRVLLLDDLARTVRAADDRLERMLRRIDLHIDRSGMASDLPPAEPFVPVRAGRAPAELDLAAEGIRSVVWATGFRRAYPWLRVPVLDAFGEIVHEDGVTPSPGLYVLGLQFLRTRKSSFIDGVGADAAWIVDRMVGGRGASTAVAA